MPLKLSPARYFLFHCNNSMEEVEICEVGAILMPFMMVWLMRPVHILVSVEMGKLGDIIMLILIHM
jgi:hypothetical protein